MTSNKSNNEKTSSCFSYIILIAGLASIVLAVLNRYWPKIISYVGGGIGLLITILGVLLILVGYVSEDGKWLPKKKPAKKDPLQRTMAANEAEYLFTEREKNAPLPPSFDDDFNMDEIFSFNKDKDATPEDKPTILNGIGSLLCHLKEYGQAEASYTKALQMRREMPEGNQLHLATILINLSWLYLYGTPDKTRSLQYAKEAIEILKRCSDNSYVQEQNYKVHLIIAKWKYNHSINN